MSKKVEKILKHVDILDLVDVKVMQPIPGHFSIAFEPHDKTKNVVIDEKALASMNAQITDRARGLVARDPNTKGFMEEFAGRLLSELYRVGLAEIVEAEEAKQDPYADLRNQYK